MLKPLIKTFTGNISTVNANKYVNTNRNCFIAVLSCYLQMYNKCLKLVPLVVTMYLLQFLLVFTPYIYINLGYSWILSAKTFNFNIVEPNREKYGNIFSLT